MNLMAKMSILHWICTEDVRFCAENVGCLQSIDEAVEAAQAKVAVVNQYEGQWEHNQRQGFGRLTHLDGTSWAGEWFGDEKHGVGCIFRAVFYCFLLFSGSFLLFSGCFLLFSGSFLLFSTVFYCFCTVFYWLVLFLC